MSRRGKHRGGRHPGRPVTGGGESRSVAGGHPAPDATTAKTGPRWRPFRVFAAAGTLLIAILLLRFFVWNDGSSGQGSAGPGGGGAMPPDEGAGSGTAADTADTWISRASLVSARFHAVYTPCWEGAYGAFGDARLFEATGDSALLRFHAVTHDLTAMCEGTWVDDRAWVCLAELEWWRVTGKSHMGWIADAVRRYDAARAEGRLSHHEGYWSWYNWSLSHRVNEPVFTNGNMNQMAAAACGLYLATGRRRFLDDAMLVWNGDGAAPGIEQRLYRGDGRWEGRGGKAAFGKELPWGGLEYASVGAALYRATGDRKYRDIAVATVRRIMDPGTGWVDPDHFYQLRMDGNGNFVQFLLDAWEIAPEELAEVPAMVGKMLDHVWTNAGGTASMVLHRASDNGIRNGWNPEGGEDGYGVDEVGTVHAQGEAAKAFGYFANVLAALSRADQGAR